jgi:hypothetical protein
MQNIKNFLKTYYIPLFLGLLVLFMHIPNSPKFVPVSGADPGVFVYIGDQILDGDIPYRDHFGNKGPLTFYINALGLLIRRSSLWGIWAIQLPILFAAALAGFKAMSKAFGKWPALFGSVAWILQLSLILRGGNFTEEYALLFQFSALLFFLYSEQNKKQMRYPILVGVSFALGFLLRPNNIGISLSVLLLFAISFLVYKDQRVEFFKRASFVMIGFLSVLTIVAIFFISVDALDDLIQNVFLFNLSLNVTGGSIFNTMLSGVDRLPNLFLIAFVAWILALTQTFSTKEKSQENKSIYALLSIALPVDMFLATFGGKAITHYFISWFPILGMLSAFFAMSLLKTLHGHISFRKRKIHLSSIWLAAFFIIISFQAIYRLAPFTSKFIRSTLRDGTLSSAAYTEQDAETVRLITRLTEEDDYLLMWGFELKFYFMTNRDSPSRFAYQYPFIAPDFATQEMIDELLHDISTKKPLIIDSSITDGSNIPWIGAPKWSRVPGMERVMDYIFTHYSVTALAGPEKWPVYEYVGVE